MRIDLPLHVLNNVSFLCFLFEVNIFHFSAIFMFWQLGGVFVGSANIWDGCPDMLYSVLDREINGRSSVWAMCIAAILMISRPMAPRPQHGAW